MLVVRALLGALVITGLLLLTAAQLVQERPAVQDLTGPVPVSLVTVPRDEAPPEEEERREIQKPEEPPRLDFAPELPVPSLTAPPLRGPAVTLDPELFGGTGPVGEMIFDARDLDTPPRGVVTPMPLYPYKARQRRIEGVVQLRILVRANGSVGEIIIESADPPGVFEDVVRETGARWRYEPGRLAGEPVAAWVLQPLRFDLSGGR